jgi:hypothetical protein
MELGCQNNALYVPTVRNKHSGRTTPYTRVYQRYTYKSKPVCNQISWVLPSRFRTCNLVGLVVLSCLRVYISTRPDL